MRKAFSLLMIGIVFVSMFVSCIPVLKASNGEGPLLRIAYVVQPDRINVPHDRVEEYGYNIWGYQNDKINFSVYLTNYGNETANDVTTTLQAPEDPQFDLLKSSGYYGDIVPQKVFASHFLLSTCNASLGSYNLTLDIAYEDAVGDHQLENRVVLKIVDIGVMTVSQPPMTPLHSEENDTITQQLIPPLRSTIVGYFGELPSSGHGSYDIVVKNGGFDYVENLTLKVIPPDDVRISTQVSSSAYTGESESSYVTENVTLVDLNTTGYVFAQGERRSVRVDITTEYVETGIYDLTARIDYVKGNNTCSLVNIIPVGIYNTSLSSTVSVCSENISNRSFAVQFQFGIETPCHDEIGFSTAGFNLSGIPRPATPVSVNESIREIIEQEFLMLFNNSALTLNKSEWTKSSLLLATMGESEIIGKAILDGLENTVGKTIGCDLSWKITGRLLEDAGFGALVELESEDTAQLVGSYYGEVAFCHALTNSAFLDDYLELFISSDYVEVQTKSVEPLKRVTIPLNLSNALNRLSANWTMVCDENSTFTRTTPEWDEVVIDSLPLTLTLDLSELKQEYNLTDLQHGDYEIAVFLKSLSSIGCHIYDITNFTFSETLPEGGYAITIMDDVRVSIDRLERSSYKAVALINWGNISGVSDTVAFNVTDGSPPQPVHNDAMDLLSAADFQTMQNQSRFFREISLTVAKGAYSADQRFVFRKSTPVARPGYDLALVSTYYNSTRNSTVLTFRMISNKTKMHTLNVTTFYADYAFERASYVENAVTLVNLTESTPRLVVLEVGGRCGYEFNIINASMHGSAAVMIIAIASLVVSAVYPIMEGIYWSEDEFNIYESQVDLEKNTPTYNFYAGEAITLNWEFRFVANGLLDKGHTYQIMYHIDTRMGETKGYTRGVKIALSTAHFAEYICPAKAEKEVEATGTVFRLTRETTRDPANIPEGAFNVEAETIRVIVPEDSKQLRSYCIYSYSYWKYYYQKRGTVKLVVHNPLTVISIEPDPPTVSHCEWIKVNVTLRFIQDTVSTAAHFIENSDQAEIRTAKLEAENSKVKVKTPLPMKISLLQSRRAYGSVIFEVKHNDPSHKGSRELALSVIQCMGEPGIEAGGKTIITTDESKKTVEKPWKVYAVVLKSSNYTCSETNDYGDAPDPSTAPGKYPSLLASEGARHNNWKHEWLGQNATGEDDSKQIDRDEFDDGVVIGGNLIPGGNIELAVTISTSGDPGRYDITKPNMVMYLNAWIDWNCDGDWEDPGEKIIGTGNPATNTQKFASPANPVYNILIPESAGDCDWWLRVRLDYAEDVGAANWMWTDPSLKQEKGFAFFGEVEDYHIVREYYYIPPPCVGGDVELYGEFSHALWISLCVIVAISAVIAAPLIIVIKRHFFKKKRRKDSASIEAAFSASIGNDEQARGALYERGTKEGTRN